MKERTTLLPRETQLEAHLRRQGQLEHELGLAHLLLSFPRVISVPTYRHLERLSAARPLRRRPSLVQHPQKRGDFRSLLGQYGP